MDGALLCGVDVLKSKIIAISVLSFAFAALLLVKPRKVMAKPEVGKAAPVFNLVELWKDALVSLEDLVYPGKARGGADRKPVLLDFFSTDCAPCKKSLPRLVALHKKLEKGSVRFFIVAIPEREQGRKKLEAYFKEHKVPFQVLVDKYGRAAKDYSSGGGSVKVPALFIVDIKGKIQLAMEGAKSKEAFDKIEKKLKALSQ